HARKEHIVVRAGIADEERAAARIAENRGSDLDADRCAFAARGGNLAREFARAGAAPSRYGTRRAARSLGRANRLAELHQRLVPVAGGALGEELLRHSRKPAPAVRRAKIAANGAKPREHAGDVAVEDGEGNIVADAQDGCGCVAADAGKREGCVERTREFAAVARDDFLRGAVQVARAAVVAEAGPEL